MKNCNYVTKNYNPLHKKEEDENIYGELKNPVTSLHSVIGQRGTRDGQMRCGLLT